jgi:hypothetical protein
MSPFGRKQKDDSSAIGIESASPTGGGESAADQPSGAPVDADLARLSALTLPQLASEVMAKGFSADYDPGDDGCGVGDLVEQYSPSPPAKLSDASFRAQRQAEAESHDPSSPRAKRLALQDLLAEGMQTLEHASLVVLTEQWDGTTTHQAYKATRLGRAALQQNAVERVVGGGALNS